MPTTAAMRTPWTSALKTPSRRGRTGNRRPGEPRRPRARAGRHLRSCGIQGGRRPDELHGPRGIGRLLGRRAHRAAGQRGHRRAAGRRRGDQGLPDAGGAHRAPHRPRPGPLGVRRAATVPSRRAARTGGALQDPARQRDPRGGRAGPRRGRRAAQALRAAHRRRHRGRHRQRQVAALQRACRSGHFGDGRTTAHHRRAHRVQLERRRGHPHRPARHPGTAAQAPPAERRDGGPVARARPGGPARPRLGGRRAPRAGRPGAGARRRGHLGRRPGEVRRRDPP